MDKNDALNVLTVLMPIVRYIAAKGDGENLARVMESTINNIGDEAVRAPAKAMLITLASTARNPESQQPAKGQ